MRIEFRHSYTLDYPSGSTITLYNDEFYIMGDDANSLFILDDDFKLKHQIRFFNSPALRINKPEKADIESSGWIGSKLWLFGSGSLSPQRDSAFCFNPATKIIEHVNLEPFYTSLRNSGVAELNIEACAIMDNHILFGNRNNLSSKQNYLIRARIEGFPSKVHKLIALNLPDAAGISGMSYLKDLDALLLTASKETTTNAYDDGEIGESYLGIIRQASKKLADSAAIRPDEWIALSSIDKAFERQKIESVCATGDSEVKEVILVSDNDDGTTKLFRLKITF
jgi:hypothetical protein